MRNVIHDDNLMVKRDPCVCHYFDDESINTHDNNLPNPGPNPICPECPEESCMMDAVSEYEFQQYFLTMILLIKLLWVAENKVSEDIQRPFAWDKDNTNPILLELNNNVNYLDFSLFSTTLSTTPNS